MWGKAWTGIGRYVWSCLCQPHRETPGLGLSDIWKAIEVKLLEVKGEDRSNFSISKFLVASSHFLVLRDLH